MLLAGAEGILPGGEVEGGAAFVLEASSGHRHSIDVQNVQN
jgi:hypothetical protein